jgi:hypothetical protein
MDNPQTRKSTPRSFGAKWRPARLRDSPAGFLFEMRNHQIHSKPNPTWKPCASHMFGTPLVFTNAPGLWSRRSTRENEIVLNREHKEIGREPSLFVCM